MPRSPPPSMSQDRLGTEYHIEGDPGLVLVVFPPKGSASPRSRSRCRRCARYSVRGTACAISAASGFGTYPATTLAAAPSHCRPRLSMTRSTGKVAKFVVDRNKAAAKANEEALGQFADLVEYGFLAERHELRLGVGDRARAAQGCGADPSARSNPADHPADIDQLASKLLAPGRNTKVMARRLIQRLKALFDYPPARCASDGGEVRDHNEPGPAACCGRRRPGSAGKYGKPEKRTHVPDGCRDWSALACDVDRVASGRQPSSALKSVLVTAQRTGELRIAARPSCTSTCRRAPSGSFPRSTPRTARRHTSCPSPWRAACSSRPWRSTPRRSSSYLARMAEYPRPRKTIIPAAMGNLHQSHLKHSANRLPPMICAGLPPADAGAGRSARDCQPDP